MKLEAGMYARTKYGILKTEEIYKRDGEYVIAIYDKVGNFVDITEIIGEPSYNIIDLIEVGDYVNGHKIVDTNSKNGDKVFYFDGEYYSDILVYFEEKDIKSIVTKEQFSSIEYKVGD